MKHFAVQRAGALAAKKSHCIITAANQPRGHRTAVERAHSAAVAVINAPRAKLFCQQSRLLNLPENISSGKMAKKCSAAAFTFLLFEHAHAWSAVVVAAQGKRGVVLHKTATQRHEGVVVGGGGEQERERERMCVYATLHAMTTTTGHARGASVDPPAPPAR